MCHLLSVSYLPLLFLINETLNKRKYFFLKIINGEFVHSYIKQISNKDLDFFDAIQKTLMIKFLLIKKSHIFFP